MYQNEVRVAAAAALFTRATAARPSPSRAVAPRAWRARAAPHSSCLSLRLCLPLLQVMEEDKEDEEIVTGLLKAEEMEDASEGPNWEELDDDSESESPRSPTTPNAED